ncbi:Uncharacterised protein [Raoultella planticola]|uniref:Uncharacterized protein n=1 Tax=Raoultella planticola TaxID=575 RepID=A0A485B1Q8_RAOPL|nr:Uncharacterised protein [Raoultella planticola]
MVILQKMLGYINIEKALLMSCPDDFDNTIAREYRSLLAESTGVEYVAREDFYAQAKSSDTLLVCRLRRNPPLCQYSAHRRSDATVTWEKENVFFSRHRHKTAARESDLGRIAYRLTAHQGRGKQKFLRRERRVVRSVQSGVVP